MTKCRPHNDIGGVDARDTKSDNPLEFFFLNMKSIVLYDYRYKIFSPLFFNYRSVITDLHIYNFDAICLRYYKNFVIFLRSIPYKMTG